MVDSIVYVGLDTDKKGIDVAVAEEGQRGEVRSLGRYPNTVDGLARALKKIEREGRRLEVCYEAGPCGYGIHRRLNARDGVNCQVVAPSMVPRRPGDRVKTNRRDAVKLARLHRAGELSAVWVPDPAHEALRDLVRSRGQAMADLTRQRQRIGGFLLRQEVGYERKPWTKAHRLFLAGLKWPFPEQQAMWAELLSGLDQAKARRERLDGLIASHAERSSLGWLIKALQALRGFGPLNAAIMVAELGDLRRFRHPGQLSAFLGMIPSEASTGEKRRQGRLTKTGNGRVRKLLVEAAWTYARPAKPVDRTGLYPAAVSAVADQARHRLAQRYRSLRQAGKSGPVAIVGVGRELAGFAWAVAHAAGPAEGAERAT